MRFVVSQDGHVVNVLPPVDITNGKLAQPFTLARHEHASIIVQVGVSAAAFTKIIVSACDNAAGDNPEAIPFDLFAQDTSGTSFDVLGARQAVLAAGYTPSANDGIFYVIELQGNQLPAGKPYVQVSLTNTTNSVIASIVAVLSGARYASDQSDTVVR